MSAARVPPTDVLDTGAAGGKAIRGGVVRTAAYVAGMLLSLVSVPLMVRHLGVVDYGYFMTVTSIVFIIGGITEAGLTNLGVREYSVLNGEERERFLRNLAGLRFALTAAGVVAAVALTAVTGARTVVVQGTALAGLGLLLALTQQTYGIPLSAQLRLGWVSALELLKQVVLTGMIVVLVVIGAGLLPFFAAAIVSALVVLAVTMVLIRGEASLRPAADLAAWRAVLRDVLPYAAAAAVGLVYFRLAVILLSYVGTDYETGIYGTAFRIVEVVGVIPWLVVSSGFPIIARAAANDSARLRYALQRMFEVSTILGVGIALGLALGAEFAIDVVAGAGFEDAVVVLRLLALAIVTSFLVATWSYALLSLRAHGALLKCNAIAAVVAAAGTVVLGSSHGAEGAAIATVAAEAALALSYLVALRRRRTDLAPGMPVLWKVALAAAVGGCAALLPVHPFVMAAAGGAAYAAVLVALRAVPPELLTALLGRDQPRGPGPGPA